MTKYTGPIAELAAGEQVNTILFRLAEAMDYEIIDGVITGGLDEILDEAVKFIQNHYNVYSY